ncbi:hypothetical protein RERY_38540 [Rhodococcus erythropolis]|nr:hypothetical protein RERY_38540 [Rhodococcus erythropolis]
MPDPDTRTSERGGCAGQVIGTYFGPQDQSFSAAALALLYMRRSCQPTSATEGFQSGRSLCGDWCLLSVFDREFHNLMELVVNEVAAHPSGPHRKSCNSDLPSASRSAHTNVKAHNNSQSCRQQNDKHCNIDHRDLSLLKTV